MLTHVAISTSWERLEANYTNIYRIIFCFFNSPHFTKSFDIYQDLISIYFPSDESNTGSTDNVTCIDDNSSDVTDNCYKISDGLK